VILQRKVAVRANFPQNFKIRQIYNGKIEISQRNNFGTNDKFAQ
jgi:hypothetical protein